MMQLLRRSSTRLVVLVILVAGCATSAYETWSDQLKAVSDRNGRAEDVSLILGTPPTRCEPIQNPPPLIGIQLESDQTVVRSVMPNSPAATAGLRPSDGITALDGQSVNGRAHLLSLLRTTSREGQPLSIQTTRGVLSVVPRSAKAEQCYWDVQGGQVARSGGSAYFNRWGGGASGGGSSYQQYFRAACRMLDGPVAGCQLNWQE